jgi:hypothetical protein
MPAEILHATHQGARNIELTFSDGATGIWNAEALLQRPGPLLVPLRDDRDGDSANTRSMSPAGSDPDTHTAAALKAWIKFFKHWKEAQAMSDLSYPPVQQAMKRLQELSRNEQDRYRALAREKALYDELYLLNDAREEGRQEGRREGREEGRQEAREEAREEARKATLARLLTRRFAPVPEWAAQRIQQATPTQLDAWLDGILDAPTLEALFQTSP